jgi:hypothetical protein
MPTLLELQTGFRAGVLEQGEAPILPEIVGDGLAPAARLGIYRNHVFTTLTNALKATFPVVCRLVDERFFAYAAHEYVRDHPPRVRCLFEYGASFAEFLAAFPPCRDLSYLPDVARLEWAVNEALHAADAPRFEPARLAAVPPDDAPNLVLRLDPALRLLASPWPIDDIWAANQPGSDRDARVDLDAGGVRLQVRRADDRVLFRRIDAVSFAFRSALACGGRLSDATDAALGEDSTFDLASALRALISEAALAGYEVSRGAASS